MKMGNVCLSRRIEVYKELLKGETMGNTESGTTELKGSNL